MATKMTRSLFIQALGATTNVLLVGILGVRIFATVTVPDLASDVLLLRMATFTTIMIVSLALLVGVLLDQNRKALYAVLSFAWFFVGFILSIVLVPWW